MMDTAAHSFFHSSNYNLKRSDRKIDIKQAHHGDTLALI